MNRMALVVAAKNMTLLIALALPVFFAMVWLQAFVRQVAGAADVGYAIETGGVYYVANVVPVLAGGLVHQLLWLLFPRDWSRTRRRLAAFVCAPVIPLAVLFSWGGSGARLLPYVVPMILALALYVIMIRSPTSAEPVAR